ncbi:glycosyltransferase [Nakamurella sp. YIM 132087]|uniref:Glycosyltransferase n=1 Tax=Nakamurella alba TaxID=2665158 RepID=A0A7K1FQ49_9ACTN|nr:glycosyltransferase [Nakamurella alba]
MKLTVVMPVYNEARTIEHALRRVLDVDYPCAVEIVAVNDGSRDDTASILDAIDDPRLRVVHHPANRGKGAAVRTGVDHATGTHMIIMDADLEYSPADIPTMLRPVLDGVADHVFGVRVFGLNTRYQSFKFAVGGRATTLAANILFDSMLTDMHTCLKLLPVAHFRALRLRQTGFGLDTELTARLLRAGVRPFEVPVSYNGRSVAEGKKIEWRDGVQCLAVLARVRREQPQHLPEVVVPRALPSATAPAPAVPALPVQSGDREPHLVVVPDADLDRQVV